MRYPVFFPQQGLGRSSPDKAQRAAIRESARFIIGKLLNAVTCE